MTELTEFQRKFTALNNNVEYSFNEMMAKHTSFRIGGPAEVMAFPKSTQELSDLLKNAKTLGIVPRILGAGTNVLAPDEGIQGLVICLKDCLDGMIQLNDKAIRVMAGVTMSRAAVYAAKLGLSGLEFAHGIPGTVGGGVYMNAGAYGGEICQVCSAVEVMDIHGDVKRYTNEEMEFSYRHSILEENGGIVISAEFILENSDPDDIRAKMKELMGKRSASQPLDLPSAGSAFKRPVGGYAAALIDQAGLKGYTVGGAAISTKHAGFAVNIGGATAADVKKLLREVSDIVFGHSGIRLEPEVRIW
jgi:UDP-N-acetylmuramate dehydrogenase